MVLTGPDCSRHQGVVDWGRVKAAGHTFAIIKLTDGTVYSHIDWGRRNLPAVRAAGLVPGAYHWLYGPKDGAAQARVYVNEVRQLGGFDGLLAVVDVERDEDGSVPSYACVRAFTDEFFRLTDGHPLLIYTGRWFWRDILGNPPGAVLGPLWHSEYESSAAEVADGPELDRYGGWPAATIWQYTSSGSCPGINGACDLNRFIGTRTELLALTRTQEDDMTPDECRKVLREELNDYLASSLSWLTTGRGNAVVNPTLQDSAWAWADDPGTVTLNEVFAAVKGVDVKLDAEDVDALVNAIAGLGEDVATRVVNQLRDRLAS